MKGPFWIQEAATNQLPASLPRGVEFGVISFTCVSAELGSAPNTGGVVLSGFVEAIPAV